MTEKQANILSQNDNMSRYLFGVINISNGHPHLSDLKLNNHFRIIPYTWLGCLVQDGPVEDLLTMSKEAVAQKLVYHQQVIEKVLKSHTIIPLKFGTFLKEDRDIVDMLAGSENLFAELLEAMDKNIELDVAAGWNDLDTVIKDIGEKAKEITALKEKIKDKPPDEIFQISLQVGALVKQALDEKREVLQQNIIQQLQGTSIQYQTHDLMEDKMILNCAFLLKADKENAFEDSLHTLDKEYEGKIDFRCVGPLPPYSFATCEVIRPDYEETDRARRLLGLKDRASAAEIKVAYRNRIKSDHPDQTETTEAQQRFEDIKSAYQYIMNITGGKEISFREDDIKQVIIVRPFNVAESRIYNQ